MRKLRADARWHTLNPEQQKKIQQWLFDDHLSYQKTHELMKAELGITCALSTIGPMYRRLAESRADDVFFSAHDLAGQLANSGLEVAMLRSASEKLIAARLLQVLHKGGTVKEITALARLTLQTESREIRQEQRDITLERLRLSAFQSRAGVRERAETEANLSEFKRTYPTKNRALPGLTGLFRDKK